MKRFAAAVLLLACALTALAADEQSFDGFIAAYRESMLNAKTIGNISAVLVEEGQLVKQGDILAQLDDRVAAANYRLAVLDSEDTSSVRQAEKQLAQAEKDLERFKKMDLSVSGVDVDKAQYAADLAKIILESKQTDALRYKAVLTAREAALEDYKVRAPFDGIVARKMIEVGETTAPIDRELFHIIDISKVYARVTIFDVSLSSKLAVGDSARVVSKDFPDRIFEGKIAFIPPTFELGGRSFTVKVLVDNPDRLLLPEMKVAVSFPPKTQGDSPAASEAGSQE